MLNHYLGILACEATPERCSACNSPVFAGLAGLSQDKTGERAWLCDRCFAEAAPLLSLVMDAFAVWRRLGQLPPGAVPQRELQTFAVAIAQVAEHEWGPLVLTDHQQELISSNLPGFSSGSCEGDLRSTFTGVKEP